MHLSSFDSLAHSRNSNGNKCEKHARYVESTAMYKAQALWSHHMYGQQLIDTAFEVQMISLASLFRLLCSKCVKKHKAGI